PLKIFGLKDEFVFFSDFQFSIRKGWDVLLKAYYEEFSNKEKVVLLLKMYEAMPGHPKSEKIILSSINSIKKQIKKKNLPRVLWFRRMLPDKMLPNLYAVANCFVLPTRGEGFCLPLCQAMSMCIPCIATNWSAHTDFANDKNCYMIDYKMIDTHSDMLWHPGYRDAKYADPSVPHLRKLMRRVFEHYEEAVKKGVRARKDILENYTWSKAADRIIERVFER
ncbi:MAG: hypothetical protein DRN17_07035, partial [Thermoplasmata archaeon]